MDYAVFYQYRHLLSNASDINEIKSICADLCTHVHFDFFCITVCDVKTLVSPKVIYLSNFPQETLDYFIQRKQLGTDILLGYAFSNTTSILWNELSQNTEKSKNNTGYFSELLSQGLNNGLSVPINSPNGQVALISLASKNRDLDEKIINDALITTEIFSRYLFDAFNRIDKIENPKVSHLTERELECVFWACEGKTAWEMAHIIGVTERTINFHLTSVIKKLGASNRQHAVAKAVLYGLVKPKA